eukprot:gene11635-biopygen2984
MQRSAVVCGDPWGYAGFRRDLQRSADRCISQAIQYATGVAWCNAFERRFGKLKWWLQQHNDSFAWTERGDDSHVDPWRYQKLLLRRL